MQSRVIFTIPPSLTSFGKFAIIRLSNLRTINFVVSSGVATPSVLQFAESRLVRRFYVQPAATSARRTRSSCPADPFRVIGSDETHPANELARRVNCSCRRFRSSKIFVRRCRCRERAEAGVARFFLQQIAYASQGRSPNRVRSNHQRVTSRRVIRRGF